MSTATLRATSPSGIYKIRKMSLVQFREWRSRDGWKYDWNHGEITKYKKMVSEKQHFIVRNVQRAFNSTQSYAQGHDLMSETEMAYDDNRYRVPDVAFYTRQQTKEAAQGAHTVSAFVIEILSDTDLAKTIENKLWEYFDEGVKVVWQILPYRQIVKVYTSPRQMVVCEAEDVCSAAPAIPDFSMTVNQIFQLED